MADITLDPFPFSVFYEFTIFLQPGLPPSALKIILSLLLSTLTPNAPGNVPGAVWTSQHAIICSVHVSLRAHTQSPIHVTGQVQAAVPPWPVSSKAGSSNSELSLPYQTQLIAIPPLGHESDTASCRK